jgi:glyceraldehyde 3-phosphate dehydrogenase
MSKKTQQKVRLAINGFGRIGRLAARIIMSQYSDKVDIVAVNDLTSTANLAYLLQYDSTYRKFDKNVTFDEKNLYIDEEKILVLSEKEPQNLPWRDLDIDVVLECSGRFLTTELASLHIQAGAKKVLLSAPAKSDEIPTVVLGVNEEILSEVLKNNAIISNASCTTNCIAPVLKILENNFKINTVNAITIHAYTATQVLQDGPSQKEFRDGRAAAINMIPSKTGAAKAVELVLPQLKNKLSLSSLRVPIITGSMIYLTVALEKHEMITVEKVNSIFESICDKENNIIEFSKHDLVSSDIIKNDHSSIIDSQLTKLNSNILEMTLWYDNEWGYANRLVDLSLLISSNSSI